MACVTAVWQPGYFYQGRRKKARKERREGKEGSMPVRKGVAAAEGAGGKWAGTLASRDLGTRQKTRLAHMTPPWEETHLRLN